MTWVRRLRFLWPAPFAILAALLPATVWADDPCSAPNPAQVFGCVVDKGLGGDAAGQALQFGADAAERALTKWVVDTAVWLLNQLVNVIFSTSSPTLSADWFHAHYADMIAVAWVTAPIFLVLGVIQAILRQDLGVLWRIVAQLLLVALLTTGAVAVAQLLIGTVDQLSAFVSR